MITVYIHGCSTCGTDGYFLRKVQAYGLKHNVPVEIINSKYDETARQDHAIKLKMAGIDLGFYPAIVDIDNHIERLRAWNSLSVH